MSRLLIRNLLFYWRTNLAVIAGVATSVSVLSGALLVGQSVRASLRDLLFQRIGATEFVVAADRFFRSDLSSAFAPAGTADGTVASCPIIFVQGVVTREATGERATKVNLVGVDDRFWAFHHVEGVAQPAGRDALVGAPLARRLGIDRGDGLLVRVETRQGVPRESLFGRREDVGKTIRLTCRGILSADQMGEFALLPTQAEVDTVFVPLSRLQQDLAQPRRANAILLAPTPLTRDLAGVRKVLADRYTLEDLGITLRMLPSQDGLSVETSRILLDDEAATAALEAGVESGLQASGVFTYLANAIRAGGREIPYSVVTAADLGSGAFKDVRVAPSRGPDLQRPDTLRPIWLTDWAARDLGVAPGAMVDLDYYRWQDEGTLVTRTARFRLAGVLPIGNGVDSSLAPDFPGITEAGSMRDWDPPFPIDLRRIRPQDEDYWNRFKATPKALIELKDGQELWQSRFGRYSAVRMVRSGRDAAWRDGSSAELRVLQDQVSERIRKRLNPERAGFTVSPVRQSGLDAAAGSTDFGEYFLYFSFFLIAAAVLLSGLFFRLGIEQRVREIGTLQAVGFPARAVRRVFLLEGAVLSLSGSIVGMAGAVAFGDALVVGLRTWWVGAVGTRQIHLHVAWGPLLSGAAAGLVVTMIVVASTLGSLQRNTARASLAGVLESQAVGRGHARMFRWLAATALVCAAALLLASSTKVVTEEGGFFGTGFLLLVAMLSVAAVYLRREGAHAMHGRGMGAMVRLAIRNAMHRPGRSLASIALVASATFVIVSVEAFRTDPRLVDDRTSSGTGGYALIGTSVLPIVQDPNTAAGREALGIPPSEVPELSGVRFAPFRERSGEDASCLNLYAPKAPTILGAPHAFVASGRFSFQSSLPGTPEQNGKSLAAAGEPVAGRVDPCHRRREHDSVHPSPIARRGCDRSRGHRRADSVAAGRGAAGERAPGAVDHVRSELPAMLPGPGGVPLLPGRCTASFGLLAHPAPSGRPGRLGSQRRIGAGPARRVHPRREHLSVDFPVARRARPDPRHGRAGGGPAQKRAGAPKGTGAAARGGVS